MTSFSTMHPEIGVMSMFWTGDGGVMVRHNSHQRLLEPFYLDSPMAAISDGAPEARRRLVGPDAHLDFPICSELAASPTAR